MPATNPTVMPHGAVLAVDGWPDAMPVPPFGPRMVYTGYGIVGRMSGRTGPERPGRESLTGAQWG